MENQKLICKSCGGSSFTKGKLEGYANIKPIDKLFSSSPLIVTLCKDCGEVASIKVKNLRPFQN